MRTWLLLAASLLCLTSLPLHAQPACPALGPVTGIARDGARISFDAVTQWVPPPAPAVCTPALCDIPTPTQISYTVYERVGTTDNVVCTTVNLGTTLAALSVGVHTWLVDARTPKSTPPNTPSAKAGPVSKTVDPAPTTPGLPGNLTVQ